MVGAIKEGTPAFRFVSLLMLDADIHIVVLALDCCVSWRVCEP
jgi:hypothetical protein